MLGGAGHAKDVRYKDDAELIAQCGALIQQKVAFSVGGHVPGPADELAIWQDAGKMRDTFIQIPQLD